MASRKLRARTKSSKAASGAASTPERLPGWQWSEFKFMPARAYAMALGLIAPSDHHLEVALEFDDRTKAWFLGLEQAGKRTRIVHRLPSHLGGIMLTPICCDDVDGMVPGGLREGDVWLIGPKEDCDIAEEAHSKRCELDSEIGNLIAGSTEWEDEGVLQQEWENLRAARRAS